MKKLLLFLSVIILTISFSACKKDSSSTPNTGFHIKKGDMITFKIDCASKTNVDTYILAQSETNIKISSPYTFSPSTQGFTATEDDQCVLMEAVCSSSIQKVTMQILVNNVVIKEGYIGAGNISCVLSIPEGWRPS